MAKRKKSTDVTYEFLPIPLDRYRAGVDASINHDARDKRHHYADPTRCSGQVGALPWYRKVALDITHWQSVLIEGVGSGADIIIEQRR